MYLCFAAAASRGLRPTYPLSSRGAQRPGPAGPDPLRIQRGQNLMKAVTEFRLKVGPGLAVWFTESRLVGLQAVLQAQANSE